MNLQKKKQLVKKLITKTLQWLSFTPKIVKMHNEIYTTAATNTTNINNHNSRTQPSSSQSNSKTQTKSTTIMKSKPLRGNNRVSTNSSKNHRNWNLHHIFLSSVKIFTNTLGTLYLKLKRNRSEKDVSQLENRIYDQTLRCGSRESTILQNKQWIYSWIKEKKPNPSLASMKNFSQTP
jgi:hypothetical protein